MPTAGRSFDQINDTELLWLSSREPDAFGAFYDRHVTDMLRFFYRRTMCSHTAADLTAETFAEALDSSGRYRQRKGTAKAWLFGIANHQLSHYHRRQLVRERYMSRLGMATISVEDAALERIEALVDASGHFAALTDGLKRLPPNLADAVVLRVGQNLAFEEVAERLGCTPGAARVRVSRALAQLAEVVNV